MEVKRIRIRIKSAQLYRIILGGLWKHMHILFRTLLCIIIFPFDQFVGFAECAEMSSYSRWNAVIIHIIFFLLLKFTSRHIEIASCIHENDENVGAMMIPSCQNWILFGSCKLTHTRIRYWLPFICTLVKLKLNQLEDFVWDDGSCIRYYYYCCCCCCCCRCFRLAFLRFAIC